MKRVLILFLVAVSLATQAQVLSPAPSPAASVSTVVGLTDGKEFGSSAEDFTSFCFRTGIVNLNIS